jgi:uncharacterized protein (DUF1778 family)
MEEREMPVQTGRNIASSRHDLLENDCCVRLSDRDADQVLAAIENPPAPNAAALTAARRFSQKHG